MLNDNSERQNPLLNRVIVVWSVTLAHFLSHSDEVFNILTAFPQFLGFRKSARIFLFAIAASKRSLNA